VFESLLLTLANLQGKKHKGSSVYKSDKEQNQVDIPVLGLLECSVFTRERFGNVQAIDLQQRWCSQRSRVFGNSLFYNRLSVREKNSVQRTY
jgi:hypothetical protein